MCGFLISNRTQTTANGMQSLKEMEYRGLRTKYRGYKTWKDYDMFHTALPMIDADPKTMLRPVMGRPLNERNICADSSITSTRSDLIDTTSRDLMSWSFDFECAFY